MALLKKQDVEKNLTYIQREDLDQSTAQSLKFETKKFASVVDRAVAGVTEKFLNLVKNILGTI